MNSMCKNNYDIKKHTTFKIGSNVDCVFFPKSLEEFIEIVKNNKDSLVLGNCSNVLISSFNVKKTIILTNKMDKYVIDENTFEVETGVKGPFLSLMAKNRELIGFEFLIGFPSTIGGAIYMNASCHNQSISDNFIEAKVFDKTKSKVETLNKSQMGFEYRKSILQNGDLYLLSAKFDLKKGKYEEIDNLMKRNIEFRKKNQVSLRYPNAGCVFKNPNNDSAGRLLDLAKCKNLSINGAKVSSVHANIVINFNNAQSIDVLKLMVEMKNRVLEKYRISLIPEIQYIGGNNCEEEKLWKILTEEKI